MHMILLAWNFLEISHSSHIIALHRGIGSPVESQMSNVILNYNNGLIKHEDNTIHSIYGTVFGFHGGFRVIRIVLY